MGASMQRSERVADGERVRTAVVLAAGLGSRLGPLTWERPKCLVSVSGVPILERLVVTLDEYGIERLVMVTGYKAEMIRDYLGERFGGIAVEYIVSPLFATTNTIYSLWLARGLIDEPFLLVESDVVFDGDLLAPLLQPDRIAVSRQLPWMNGTTVTLDADGHVNALYPPPPGVYVQHCTAPDHFMTVNICSLARDTWGDRRRATRPLRRRRSDRLLSRRRVRGDDRGAGHGSRGRDLPRGPLVRDRHAGRPGRGRARGRGTPADHRRVGAAGARRGTMSQSLSRPPLTGLVRDLPNLCSLAGLAAAVLGIFFALRGVYPAAMMALLWAVVFDWTDGIIARRMSERTADQRAFGAQLDSLIDIVSFSVAPALLLLSVGDFSAWFVPGAFVILAAGAIRLSYFNVFGLLDGSTYRGLSLDNNVLVLALLFVVEPLVPATSFAIAAYVVLLVLAALNLAPFETPKLGGRWYWAVIAYASVMKRDLRVAAAVTDGLRTSS